MRVGEVSLGPTLDLLSSCEQASPTVPHPWQPPQLSLCGCSPAAAEGLGGPGTESSGGTLPVSPHGSLAGPRNGFPTHPLLGPTEVAPAF